MCSQNYQQYCETVTIKSNGSALLLGQVPSQTRPLYSTLHIGMDNLADYFTKHHSPSYHHLMHSHYLVDLHKTNTIQNLPGKGVLIPTSGLPQT
jgi:hypothetical protein